MIEAENERTEAAGAVRPIEDRLNELLGPLWREEAALQLERDTTAARLRKLDQELRKIARIRAAVTPEKAKAKAKPQASPKGVSRERMDAIYAFIQTHPNSSAPEAAAATGCSSSTAQAVLGELRREQRVFLAGVRQTTHGKAPRIYATAPPVEVTHAEVNGNA